MKEYIQKSCRNNMYKVMKTLSCVFGYYVIINFLKSKIDKNENKGEKCENKE